MSQIRKCNGIGETVAKAFRKIALGLPDAAPTPPAPAPGGSDEFLRAYLECALWASTDDSGEPLDKDHDASDLAPDMLAQAKSDCDDFQAANAADLALVGSPGQNGHDFFLTRCGHGAGFWDRGYDKDVAKRLTDNSHAYGDVSLYVGDDGKIHSN